MDDSQQPPPEETAGPAPDAEPEDPPVNSLTVDALWVKNLPQTWCHADSGEPPDYRDNLFQWELDVALREEAAGDDGGATLLQAHCFKGGRLRQVSAQLAAQIKGPGAGTGAESDSGSAAVGVPSTVARPEPSDNDASPASAAPEASSALQTAASASSSAQSFDTPQTAVIWYSTPDTHDPPEAQDPPAPPLDAAYEQPTHSRTFPLPAKASTHVQNLLEQAVEQTPSTGCLQFTIRRALNPAKVQPDWEDANEAYYTSKGQFPLLPFAEPGTTTFVYCLPLAPSEDPAAKADDKKGKKPPPKKPAKGAVAPPAFLSAEDEPVAAGPAGEKVHPYEARATCLCVRVSFERPLVTLPGKRLKPSIVPADIIPARVKPAQVAMEATKAFGHDVLEIVGSVVADLQGPDASDPLVPRPPFDASEDHRKTFLHFLSSSGRSYAHREKLKHCIVRIVKEKFAKKPGTSKAVMERFYNELYVYLLDQMHFTLNKALSRDELGPAAFKPDEDRNDKWLRLATEAEAVQEEAMAERFHQERLVHAPAAAGGQQESPAAWGDYARYCLRIRDGIKAEQAFKEALAIEMAHVPSLLGYGLLLLCNGRLKESEVFLQAAVDADMSSPLAWGALALYFEVALLHPAETPEQQDEHRHWGKHARTQAARASAEGGGTVAAAPESLDLQLAGVTLDLHLEPLTQHCIDNVNRAAGGSAVRALVVEGRMQFQMKENDKARERLEEAVKLNGVPTAELHILLGDVYSAMGQGEVAVAKPDGSEHCMDACVLARDHYTAAMEIDEAQVPGQVYARLGNLYSALGRYSDAADAFVLAARKWPCGVTWMGLGISCYRLERYEHAEQALNESNLLNNLNPKTWAYVTLVCLRRSDGKSRHEEADQAFHQALNLGLADHALLAEVGAEYLRSNRVHLAEAALSRSLHVKDAPKVHLMLANALLLLKRYDEAAREFTAVVDASPHEPDRAKAREMLETMAKYLE
ncbi:hypothetical protein DIPPA_00932 [Diplonema papillatum]|nr:hypothetical protein DIPPA_00932 [Diplonema papillatum]